MQLYTVAKDGAVGVWECNMSLADVQTHLRECSKSRGRRTAKQTVTQEDVDGETDDNDMEQEEEGEGEGEDGREEEQGGKEEEEGGKEEGGEGGEEEEGGSDGSGEVEGEMDTDRVLQPQSQEDTKGFIKCFFVGREIEYNYHALCLCFVI